jgi:hypothetical protein
MEKVDSQARAVHIKAIEAEFMTGQYTNSAVRSVRTTSPEKGEIIVGDTDRSNNDIRQLVLDMKSIKELTDPEFLAIQILACILEWEWKGITVNNHMDAITMKVVRSIILSHGRINAIDSNYVILSNMNRFSQELRSFILHGVRTRFITKEGTLEADGQVVKIVRKCPIRSLAEKEWVPVFAQAWRMVAKVKPELQIL